MQKLKLPSFSRKLKIGTIGVALMLVAAFALGAYAQSLAPTDLQNTGTIAPPVGTVSSPLLMMRDDSVYIALNQANNESALVPITKIDWGKHVERGKLF